MKPLGERVKHRLRIAAGLLRGSDHRSRVLAVSRANFYSEIADLIRSLTLQDQQVLRDQTDWVEAYDNGGPRVDKAVPTAQRAGRVIRRKAPTFDDA